MAEDFNALVTKIRDWSNRDADILTDALISDFMRYAADKAYRVLRIPPLEKTVQYTFEEDSDAVTNNCIPVPTDLIEFIHIRQVDAFGTGNSIVYNNKSDTRTFHDFAAEKYDPRYTWTRQGNQILVPAIPGIVAGCTYEVYYYGRLGALDTTYAATFSNWQMNTDGLFVRVYLTSTLDSNNMADENSTLIDPTDVLESTFDTNTSGDTPLWTAIGQEAPNWLRDENERIILFGALAEAFSYLGEDDMMQKYMQKFGEEIATLNDEEGKRRASGGNVQINFDGRGMI